MAGAQYLFPSPDAVREEEQTITAGLSDEDQKKECHDIYANLLTFLEAGKEHLENIRRTAGGHFLTDDENLILMRAGGAFEKAETFARRIEAKYQRLIEVPEHVDKTVDGISPEPPHKIDKLA